MISKHTFSEVLDTLRERYIAGAFPGISSSLRGTLADPEDAIITILSECMGDEEDVIYDWVHGLLISDEFEVSELEICSTHGFTRNVRIEDAGDLYDYLMITNNPYQLAKIGLDEYFDELCSGNGGDYE